MKKRKKKETRGRWSRERMVRLLISTGANVNALAAMPDKQVALEWKRARTIS